MEDVYELDELDRKVVEHFPGQVVRKGLTSLLKRGANVPTFVLEYLLGMYCSTEDPEAVGRGIERIRRILAENYVRPDESEKIKSRIRELGQYTVIDKVSARLDEFKDIYVAQFANLEIEPFVMPAEYVREYTKILTGGIWCIMRIEYRRSIEDEDALNDVFDDGPRPDAPKKKKPKKSRGPEDSRFNVVSLKPIQMPNLNLEEFVAQREHFTTDEWECLILRSAGYEPEALSERERMHFLERMVPLVERNYNLCELGPRGTGKSHIYKEVSPYSILLSGGQTSTANLFMDLRGWRRGSVGLVGHWDCITFDEVAGMHFKDENAVQIMKDYMASGSFARGRDQVNADASMVFEGNINDTVENVLKTTHLFDPFPPEFNNDSAFFDRMHCYLPGWEVPKMRSELLTERYGLITDCLAEFCKEMRRRDFSHEFGQYFRLNADFNKRDEIAVRKTFSGLAKLLYPDGHISKEDARLVLDYAVEGRRRVKEQLKIMAGVEFMDVNLGYIDVDDPSVSVVVPVPEQAQETLIPEGNPEPGFVYGLGKSATGEWGVYRLENRAVGGKGGFDIEGLQGWRQAKESLEAAFKCFKSSGDRVASGMRIEEKDFRLFANDLQGRGPSAEVSLAEFVGLCSAACRQPVLSSLVVPGILRISGSMDELRNLEDVMRVAANAGARKVLLPLSCAKDLGAIPMELLGKMDPVFYADNDPVSAARRALDL